MDRDDMIRRLKSKLNEKRFIHSIGVEYTAANLAFRYGVDVKRARIAGLLHDCAKCIPVTAHIVPVSACSAVVNFSPEYNLI